MDNSLLNGAAGILLADLRDQIRREHGRQTVSYTQYTLYYYIVQKLPSNVETVVRFIMTLRRRVPAVTTINVNNRY